MVNFNEIRICEGQKKMVIDCSIESSRLYSDMHIDSIYLDYYKNLDNNGLPSQNAVKIFEADNITTREKRVVLLDSFLTSTNWGISSFAGELFYVIVVCDGMPPIDAMNLLPCGFDDTVSIAVVPDWDSFYKTGMQYVSSFLGACRNKCDVPADFENFILLWEAFKLAISTCDWNLVADIWKRMMKVKSGITSISSGCGCGR